MTKDNYLNAAIYNKSFMNINNKNPNYLLQSDMYMTKTNDTNDNYLNAAIYDKSFMNTNKKPNYLQGDIYNTKRK
jgi:hypothetical protein